MPQPYQINPADAIGIPACNKWMYVCDTKSLIGWGLRMEESVFEFYRVLTPLYTQ
jgi:hypothetical protein